MRLPSSASSTSSSSSSGSSAKLPAHASPLSTKAGRRRMDKELTQFKSAYPLQRGSACLSCRKRKMKCDAGKPACGQCVKANRTSDCDYDDGKSKSRTQVLQEKIAVLEGRLRDLEGSPPLPGRQTAPQLQRYHSNPGPVSSNAYDGVAPGMFGSNAFDLAAMSATGSPSAGSPSGSPWMGAQYLQIDGAHELSQVTTPDELPWDIDPLTMTPDDLFRASGRWWEAEEPSPRIRQLLIDIFMPHRHQCGFEIDLARFQASLSTPDAPHPALLNAIYALACHFSLSPLLTPHESRFVSRSLGAISDALEASDRLLHVVHASCLLAVLLFAKGRLLEGYYHAGAAARLAVGLGLHQIEATEWTSPAASPASSPGQSSRSRASASSNGPSILPPPVDSIELGERILAFWQVFNLDRCWAVATGLPVALSDDNHPRTRIGTAWPRSLEEYEVGPVCHTDLGSVNFLYSQVTNIPLSTHDSTNTLRAKATTLFERAARLSSSFGTSAQSAEQFWVEFQTVDSAISQLSISVPPVHTTATEGSEVVTRVDHALFVVHVLLHAATVQLHSPFALKDASSQQRSATVAALATAMIHDLDELDYSFLDPIMGTCWTSIAEALVRELIVVRGSSTIEQVTSLNRQLDIVVMAMNRLGATVPLAAYQASKVEQSRAISF